MTTTEQERERKMSPVQARALRILSEFGGEAIRCGHVFLAGGGRVVCDRLVMERMEKKGLVRLETVGESVFACAA